jgi:lactoylglutathione lyase
MSRPFEILGLQQIAVGAASKEPLRKLWVDMLGLAPSGHFVSEKENVDEDIVLLGSGPFQVEVDLMQPLDPARSPRVDQPAEPRRPVGGQPAGGGGMADGARRALRAGRHPQGRVGHDIAFLHPKANEDFRLPAPAC